MKRRAWTWLLVLLVAPIVVAADEWSTPPGVARERWLRMVEHFRAKPYTPGDIQPCWETIASTARDGLPVEAVLSRLEEGAAKQVDAAALQTAVRQRLESLRAARELLRDSNYDKGATADRLELLIALATARENAVPDDGLRHVLKRGSGGNALRLVAVIEAGETLKLLGVDDETVSALMEDFAARNLPRGDILRAVRLVGQYHRDGKSGPDICAALWIGSADAEQPRGTGHRHGRGR